MVTKNWNKKYYKVSQEASKSDTHIAAIAIKKYALKAKKILDIGCGEGTRIGLLKTTGKKFGVDINNYAINKAKKNYPEVEFIKSDIVKIPFDFEYFDLIYSMFVIEHVLEPEKVLKEAIRVLKKDGIFILGAPNYGSPNRRSPVSKENKFLKLFKGLSLDFDENSLGWNKVKPAKGRYFIDSDTTVEPYILSLVNYLKNFGLKIIKFSSLWEIDDFSIKQLPFKILGLLGFYPFVWWGPQIFVIAKK